MKSRTLPVKRRPAQKGILKRLSAVTQNRKQRVAAASPADMEVDDGSSKISRALTIIFLIHIVAIGLIFIHQQFLDGRPGEGGEAKSGLKAEEVQTVAAPAYRSDLPQLASKDNTHIVGPGDNYSRIAAGANVDEAELRLLNKHVPIGPGVILKLPPKRIVAVESPEVTALRQQSPASRSNGLVDAVDVSNAPRAQLVRPNIHPSTGTQAGAASNSAAAGASGKSYVVQQGDSVWRIANRFKVNQAELMKANNISDARKVKVGMNLVIPR
jgi:LysM repeat protein